jgi:exonuclease III
MGKKLEMRILTYNILDGGVNRESLILKIIEVISPDIVMLQEVFESTPLKDFALQLNMHYFLARGNSRRHLAILSRYSIIEAYSYRQFLPLSKSTLYAKLEYEPGRFIHTFGLHLFPHPFIVFELWRKWEKEIALRKANLFVSEPCFLAGDFNAIAPADYPDINSWPRLLNLMLTLQGGRLFHFAIRDILLKGFADCYRTMHPETQGYTLPTSSPTTRLDYIFANQILHSSLKSCDIIWNLPETQEASDHYPLLAEFDI